VRLSRPKRDKLPLDRRVRKVPRFVIGAVTLLLILGLFYGGVKRHAIQTALASGHTVQAQFDRDYLLRIDQTKVKVSGVPVGVVSAVKQDQAGALVTMKVFGNNADRLGTSPSAQLRIESLLGGINYVQLTPGGPPGRPHQTIPMARTTTPVYVDSILSAVPPPAQEGMKKFTNQFSTTLTDGGTKSTQSLLSNAPGALQPATGVLQAFQGNSPGDLTALIANLENTDATLTAQQGQIESVVSGLGTFSNTLGTNAAPLQNLAATLPSDLSNARNGLTALSSTLHEVTISANLARPTVDHLDTLINQSQPFLVDARPVLDRLQPLLTQLDPLLGQLVPTSTQLTSVLNGINGPVLDRLLKPTDMGAGIIPSLVNARSSGPTALPADERETAQGNGAVNKPFTLYQAIAYSLTGVDGTFSYHDNMSHMVPVEGGFNQYSFVPSPLLDPSTDTCAGLSCPGNASGNGPTNSPVPKSVAPPGVQP
jgi:phospholipid/cholesterol/gamma-HCH transport system substrate-binding protein